MSQNYSYFAHKECEYFPCHKGADPDIKKTESRTARTVFFRTDAKTTKRLSRATRIFWAY